MARRYYLTPIIGDGTEGNFFRPKLPAGVSYVAEIKTGPDGKPAVPWALVLVNTVNHLPLLTDPDIDALPDFPKDVKINAMNAATRSDMAGRLSKRRLPTDIVQNADGFRDVLRGIGRQLNPNFHEDNFDVAD